ncbi:MAG: amino acid adenylation domain-containing protein [Polyangiaceae bacterium]
MKRDLGKVGGRRRLFGPVVNVMPFGERFPCRNLEIRSHGLASGPVEDLAINLVVREQGAELAVEGNLESYTKGTLEDYRQELLSLLAASSDLGHAWRGKYTLGSNGEEGSSLRGIATSSEVTSSEVTQATAAALSLRDTFGISFLPPVQLPEIPQDPLWSLLRRADQNPHVVALEQDGERSLTYGELIGRGRRMARILRARGVRPNDCVVLLLPRHPTTIVAQIAVHWLGAYFVPLDPEGPPERLRSILDEIQPALVVTESSAVLSRVDPDEVQPALVVTESSAVLSRVDPDEVRGVTEPVVLGSSRQVCSIEDLSTDEMPEAPWSSFDVPAAPGELAYVIYTSGSTGKPRGVAVSRASLSHFVVAANTRYSITPADRVLQFAPLQFDASIEEIWITLSVGATLVLRTEGLLGSIEHFLRGCERARITVIDLPTAFWHELVHTCSLGRTWPSTVRLVIIGGEAALPDRVMRFCRLIPDSVTLVNSYGPTETTVVCATAHLGGQPSSRFDSVPIGRPLPGIGMVVLDDEHRIVARGISGQLGVWGPTLARGYVADPASTGERFVVLPCVNHERVYLTGDKVVLGDDDRLYFVGRADDEVKLSGHRVRLVELENLLSCHVAVREAAVVLVGRERGTRTIVAFAKVEGTDVTADTLMAHLARHLPPVLRPSKNRDPFATSPKWSWQNRPPATHGRRIDDANPHLRRVGGGNLPNSSSHSRRVA